MKKKSVVYLQNYLFFKMCFGVNFVLLDVAALGFIQVGSPCNFSFFYLIWLK